MFKNNTFSKKNAISLFLVLLFLASSETFYPVTLSAQTVDQAAQRAQWEADLKSTEADIAKWQAILDSSKKNTASLQNEANILTAKINQAKANIKQKNIAIAQLDQDISVKNATIMTLEDKIQNSKNSIGQLIR